MRPLETAHAAYNEGTKKLSEIRTYFFQLLPYWIAGGLTAVVATTYARVFALAEGVSIQLFERTHYYFLLIPPIFFALSWLIVEKIAPRSNGSGIPQLMASVELAAQKKNAPIRFYLGFRIIAVKIVSSLLGVLGGGAIGREGPTLQISGSIFHLVNRYWTASPIHNRAAFLLAGAASGLASAFNTPLGGIVYVIEELAKSHLSSFRTGVIHAVIVAGIISQMFMGSYLYLGLPKVSFEIANIYQCVLIAMVASLVVTFFAQALKELVRVRERLRSSRARLLFAVGAGLAFAAVAVGISKNAIGPGNTLVTHLLFTDVSASVGDVVSRFLGSFLTYANGGAGGIFAPTLSLGGSTASLVDHQLHFDLGALSVLIGMSAGLAALTHSPLTSFILILEMTDRHNVIFPLMLASIIGHGISKSLSGESFYEFVYSKIISEEKAQVPPAAPGTAGV